MNMHPIAVSILTGFLGAGKTTLLNRILKDPALTNTAVIINEFGEVAIDHLLVEQSTDGVIELSDGCLCCMVRGELVDTLSDLIDRMQTGKIGALERIVIETTGLADPVPVLQSVMAHPALMQALRLDGVVTVVDTVNGAATLANHPEARRQVAVADRLVLAKTELAESSHVAELTAKLRGLNPGAEIVKTEDPIAGSAALVACGLYDPATKTADVERWLGDGHHGHSHDHDHAHDHHDPLIRTFSLVHDQPMPYSTIETFLDLLRSTQGERLLRMKGIIEIAEDPERPLVIHGVQQLLHPPARLPAWPQGARGTRLVLITHDLAEDYVQRLFGAFVGRPSLDMPDRAAMTDNPLAVAGFSVS